MQALDNIIQRFEQDIIANPSDSAGNVILSKLSLLQKNCATSQNIKNDITSSDLPEQLKSELLRSLNLTTDNSNTLLYEKNINGILISIQYIDSMKKYIQVGKFNSSLSWNELIDNATLFYTALKEYALQLLAEGFILENLSAEHIESKYGNTGNLYYIISAYNDITNVAAKNDLLYYKRAESSLVQLQDEPFRTVLLNKFHNEFGDFGNKPRAASKVYKPYLNVTKFPANLSHLESDLIEIRNPNKDVLIVDQSTLIDESVDEEIYDNHSENVNHTPLAQPNEIVKSISPENQSEENQLKIYSLIQQLNTSVIDLQSCILEHLNPDNSTNQIDLTGVVNKLSDNIAQQLNKNTVNVGNKLDSLIQHISSSKSNIDVNEFKQFIASTLKDSPVQVNLSVQEIKALFEPVFNIFDDKIKSSADIMKGDLKITLEQIKLFLDEKFRGFNELKVANHISENLQEYQSNFLTNSAEFLNEFKSETILQLENYGLEIDRRLGTKLTDTHLALNQLNSKIETTNNLLSVGGKFNWFKSIGVGAVTGLLFFAIATSVQLYFNGNSKELAQYKQDSEELSKIYATVQGMQDVNNKTAIVKILGLKVNEK